MGKGRRLRGGIRSEEGLVEAVLCCSAPGRAAQHRRAQAPRRWPRSWLVMAVLQPGPARNVARGQLKLTDSANSRGANPNPPLRIYSQRAPRIQDARLARYVCRARRRRDDSEKARKCQSRKQTTTSSTCTHATTAYGQDTRRCMGRGSWALGSSPARRGLQLPTSPLRSTASTC